MHHLYFNLEKALQPCITVQILWKMEQSFNLTARLFAIKRLETSPLSRFFLITAYGRKKSINSSACAVAESCHLPPAICTSTKNLVQTGKGIETLSHFRHTPNHFRALTQGAGSSLRSSSPKRVQSHSSPSEGRHLALSPNIKFMSRPMLWRPSDCRLGIKCLLGCSCPHGLQH